MTKDNLMFVLIGVLTLSLPLGTSAKGREPCSGSKGGISHCDGTKFVCNDSSYSQSQRICIASEYSQKEKQNAETGTVRTTSEKTPLGVSAKQMTLTAEEAKHLAADTMAYFTARRAQFSEDAVMNDDALRATFQFSTKLKGILARWPTILDGNTEADKYGHCRHLILTAQSYAEAMNHFAFKGGSEKLAKERRKDFKKDWNGCEVELTGRASL